MALVSLETLRFWDSIGAFTGAFGEGPLGEELTEGLLAEKVAKSLERPPFQAERLP